MKSDRSVASTQTDVKMLSTYFHKSNQTRPKARNCENQGFVRSASAPVHTFCALFAHELFVDDMVLELQSGDITVPGCSICDIHLCGEDRGVAFPGSE